MPRADLGDSFNEPDGMPRVDLGDSFHEPEGMPQVVLGDSFHELARQSPNACGIVFILDSNTPKCQREMRINYECMVDGINKCKLNVH